MTIKSFLKLVEIQTKVASLIPYLVGTAFALYKFNNFNISTSLLLLIGILIFDMTTTTINNYFDYKNAIKKEGFGYEVHNAIVRYNLNPKFVLILIFIMLFISSLLGILLFINTNIVILITGIICFSIGILYSFGPIPISRTPLGEVFSGITMGFFITFLSIYINVLDKSIIEISLINETLSLVINIKFLLSTFIIALPCICGISNIMLANNICDIEDDIINKRYTLPIYIGKDRSLILFSLIYYTGLISIILGVILGILPVTSLLTLLIIIPITNNIKSFVLHQSKETTFILSVQNFISLNVVYILSIFLGIIFKI